MIDQRTINFTTTGTTGSSSPKLQTLSNNGSVSSMTLSEFLKEIGCDHCLKTNPSKRCSRCHLTFYCSTRCQKLQWKNHKEDCKTPTEYKRLVAGIKDTLPLTVTVEDAANHPVSDSCSICLSVSIEDSIVLPDCGHIFCFPCLFQWILNVFDYRKITSATGRCPCCRKTIVASIVDAALDKALLYAAAGRLTEKVYDHSIKKERNNNYYEPDITMDERQEKYYQLATEQVNKVLAKDPKLLAALCVKGQILRYLKPIDSIVVLNEVLQLDSEGIKKQQDVVELGKELDALGLRMASERSTCGRGNKSHPMNKTRKELVEKYENLVAESKKISQLGDGPYRLYPIRIWLAEAYEGAGQYTQAKDIYYDMMRTVFSLGYQDVGNMTVKMILAGVSRCLYQLKDYNLAETMAQSALALNRHFSGLHILVAKSQWKLNEKQAAVRTMSRSVLYETSWDERNEQQNRKYLQEFVDAMTLPSEPGIATTMHNSTTSVSRERAELYNYL